MVIINRTVHLFIINTLLGMVNLSYPTNHSAFRAFQNRLKEFKVYETAKNGSCLFISTFVSMYLTHLSDPNLLSSRWQGILASTSSTSSTTVAPDVMTTGGETIKNLFVEHLHAKIEEFALFPYARLPEFSAFIEFNLLVIVSDRDNSSMNPYRIFVSNPLWRYIMIHWNNLEVNSHAESVYLEWSSGKKGFTFSNSEFQHVGLDEFFDTKISSSVQTKLGRPAGGNTNNSTFLVTI